MQILHEKRTALRLNHFAARAERGSAPQSRSRLMHSVNRPYCEPPANRQIAVVVACGDPPGMVRTAGSADRRRQVPRLSVPDRLATPPRSVARIVWCSLFVNGREHTVDVDPATPILWALRDTLGMTGTKFGCGAALCGACTVHLDGEAIRSCSTPVSEAEGKKITTIEAVDRGRRRHRRRRCTRPGVKHDVAQCGYCQSGQIMSATAFLRSLPGGTQPAAADIDAGHGRQHLPLRHLCPHPCGRRRCRQHARLKEPPCCTTSTPASCRALFST